MLPGNMCPGVNAALVNIYSGLLTYLNTFIRLFIIRFAGHIPGLRDQIGVTYGCATTQLLQPGGLASTPAWTGPSAARPQWSTPGSIVDERPAWLGAAFDYYTAPPPSNYCDKSAMEILGQGQTRGRPQGRSCEFVSLHLKRRVSFDYTYLRESVI